MDTPSARHPSRASVGPLASRYPVPGGIPADELEGLLKPTLATHPCRTCKGHGSLLELAPNPRSGILAGPCPTCTAPTADTRIAVLEDDTYAECLVCGALWDAAPEVLEAAHSLVLPPVLAERRRQAAPRTRSGPRPVPPTSMMMGDFE